MGMFNAKLKLASVIVLGKLFALKLDDQNKIKRKKFNKITIKK